jgi:hypothetical protein
MIARNSLVVDSYDDCYDIGIYYEDKDGKEWVFWLGSNKELFTKMGGLIVISAPILGKW